MSTLDIRALKDSEITEIQFDDSNDRITRDMYFLRITTEDEFIIAYEDMDNFIAACQKAKELWDR